MNSKSITAGLYQTFLGSFWLTVGCFVGMIVVGVVAPQNNKAIGTLAIVFVLAGPVWYVSLGMIAHRLGRRWLLWVLLAFFTSPIGPLVIFPLMLGHIRTASQGSGTQQKVAMPQATMSETTLPGSTAPPKSPGQM